MTTKAKVGIAVSAAAVVLFCGFIFYMSAQPADDSDVMSLGIVYRIISFIVPGYADMSYADQVYWQSSLNHIVRKAAHFSEFALLGMLVANLLYRIARATAQHPRILTLGLAAWLLTTAYAATDEIHQLFVPGRAGMVADVMLDSCGALTGVALFCAVLAIVRAIRKRRNRIA